MTSIKVAIKVRPLIRRELAENLPVQWMVSDNAIFPLDSDGRKKHENGFQFDHVFDMQTTNHEVFDAVVSPIIEAAVNGFNGTIFAYGQTSSGKTFTMMGNEYHPGILPLTIHKMFHDIENTTGREFLLRVAYMEIYNERVNDLLDKENKDVKVREENGEVVVKCKEEIILTTENILTLMRRGDKHRQIGKTDMNEYSSRSHSIFRITIESKETSSDSEGAVQVSQLNLVDLAGSERASATGATGERFKEGRHINLSLTALGKVIMQLSDNQEFVSFRDSKLTRILQASLGGNAMTAIICTVTPAVLEETTNTLNFASRAKSIKNKPKLNEVMSDAALLKRYRKQIEMLSQKLKSLDDKRNVDEVKEMADRLEETKRLNEELNERINRLQGSILCGNPKVLPVAETAKQRAKRRQTWAAPHRHSVALPTIIEHDSPEKFSLSILTDDGLGVPLSDIEIELYNSQQSILLDDADDLPGLNRTKVTFADQHDSFCNNAFLESPPRSTMSSPGTPRSLLREKLIYTIDEFESLKDLTTLEKQLLAEDPSYELKSQFVQLKREMRIVRQENQSLRESLREKDRQTELSNKQNEEIEKRFGVDEETKMGDESDDSDLIEKLEYAEGELVKLKSVLDGKTVEDDPEKGESEEDSMMSLLKHTEEQLAEVKKQVAVYEDRLNNLEMERQELEEKSRRDSEKVATLEGKVETLEAENSVMAEKMNQLSRMRREKEELIGRNQDLENKQAAFEEQVKEQSKQIQELLEERQRLQEDCEKLSKEGMEESVCKMKAEKDGLSEELRKMVEECERLKMEVKSVEEKAAVYEKKILLSDKIIKRMEEENSTCKEKLADFEGKCSDYEKRMIELDEEREELIKRVKSLEEKEKESLDDRTNEIEKLKKEYLMKVEELTCKFDSEKTSMVEEALLQERSSNSELLAELQEALGVEKNAVGDLSRMLEEGKAALSTIESELQENKRENEHLIGRVKELDEQIEEYKIRNNELEVQLQVTESQKSQIEQLELQCRNDSEQIALLQQSLEEKKQEIIELQDRFAEQKPKLIFKEITHLEDLLEQEKQNFNNLALKCEDQHTQLSAEKSVLQEQLNESKIQLQDQCDFSEKQLEENEVLVRKVEDLTHQKEEYQSKVEELEKKILALEAEKPSNEVMQAEKQRFDDIVMQYEEQCQRLNRCQQENQDFIAKLEELKIKEKEREAKCQQLEERISILEQEKSSIEVDSENQKEALKVQYEEQCHLLKEYQQEKVSLASQINELTEQNQQYQSTLLQLSEDRKLAKTYKLELESLQKTLQDENEKNEKQQQLINELQMKTATYQQQLLEKDEIFSKIKSNNNSTPEAKCKLDANQKFDSLERSDSESLDKSASLIRSISELNTPPLLQRTLNESLQKSSPLDSSSIFNNDSYFDRLDGTQDETFEADSTLEKSVLINENRKLHVQLQAKIQETRDIENAVQDLKNGICKLEKTICDLNSENAILSENLSKEKAKSMEMVSKLQDNLEQLQVELQAVNSEKLVLESKLSTLSEATCVTCEKLQEQLVHYENKLATLTEENLQLSQNQKPETVSADEKRDIILALESVTSKNNELSNELFEKTEELNNLKQQHENLVNVQEQNEIFKCQVDDLRNQVERLQQANDKLSADLMEAVEELQNSSGSNVEFLMKIQTLEEKIQLLNQENEKLSEARPCCCNESKGQDGNRRSIKAEVKNLSRLQKDLQKKYERQVADSEPLRTKAKESLDESLLNDSLNVSMIEEKVLHADNEFESLTEIHRLLSISFQRKYEEVEKVLKMISTSFHFAEELNSKTEKKDKIDKLYKELDTLRYDLTKMSSDFANIKVVLDKFGDSNRDAREEMELIRLQNEELKEKMTLLETTSAELVTKNNTLIEEVAMLRRSETELEDQKSSLTSELGVLKKENSALDSTVQSLEKSAQEMKELQSSLKNELEVLKEEKEQLIARQKYTDSVLQEYKDNVEEFEAKLKEMNNSLGICTKEKDDLKNQLTKLQSDNKNSSLNNSIKKEIDEFRIRIVKETRSLDPNANVSTDRSINDLFGKFLETLMKKEAEIVNNLHEQITLGKVKLQDEKNERNEMEKKSSQWVKSLEAENEKLQAECTDLEKRCKELLTSSDKFEENVKMLRGENLSLKNQIKDLENECQTNLIELEKYRKMDMSLNVAQEREQRAQELLQKKESELVKKLTSERDEYAEKVESLVAKIETLKSKNKELVTSMNVSENNEKQLKSVIEANSSEITRLNHEINDLKIQLEQVSAAYTNLNSEILEKNNHIESIAVLMKEKCDKYSEYKTKLETLISEYNTLMEQHRGLKSSSEKYKNETGTLKQSLQDAKSEIAALKKCLEDETMKNITLQAEHDLLQEQYAKLEVDNSKLSRKVRNSTCGPPKMNDSLEELLDKNKMLQNNLDGVSNRLIVLQKENADFRNEIAQLVEQNKTYKDQLNDSTRKNGISCETSNNTDIATLQEEVARLTTANKELDTENEELAKMINSLEDENADLLLKVTELETAAESKETPQYSKANPEAEETTSADNRLQVERLQKNISSLTEENKELKLKISTLEDKLETMSSGSGRSNSPAFEMGLRRQRRSNQFNMNRNLEANGICECASICTDDSSCACNDLRQQIKELELKLVDKDCRISTLELQIQCESFPLQEKIKQLKESVTAYQHKVSELRTHVQKLERTMQTTAPRDCEVCKKRIVSKREQGVQFPEKTIGMFSIQSGVVEEDVRLRKLTKDKEFMRHLCREQKNKLIKAEATIKKYEELFGILDDEG